jgi:hypothetical protein
VSLVTVLYSSINRARIASPTSRMPYVGPFAHLKSVGDPGLTISNPSRSVTSGW